MAGEPQKTEREKFDDVRIDLLKAELDAIQARLRTDDEIMFKGRAGLITLLAALAAGSWLKPEYFPKGLSLFLCGSILILGFWIYESLFRTRHQYKYIRRFEKIQDVLNGMRKSFLRNEPKGRELSLTFTIYDISDDWGKTKSLSLSLQGFWRRFWSICDFYLFVVFGANTLMLFLLCYEDRLLRWIQCLLCSAK